MDIGHLMFFDVMRNDAGGSWPGIDAEPGLQDVLRRLIHENFVEGYGFDRRRVPRGDVRVQFRSEREGLTFGDGPGAELIPFGEEDCLQFGRPRNIPAKMPVHPARRDKEISCWQVNSP
jgi:hypothetical protein